MSSLPGLDLEDYLMWNYDLIVDDNDNANVSLQIAERLKLIPIRRKPITQEQFRPLVDMFEQHRDQVEYLLSEFDEDSMSWRDYSGVVSDYIEKETFDKGLEYLNSLNTEQSTGLIPLNKREETNPRILPPFGFKDSWGTEFGLVHPYITGFNLAECNAFDPTLYSFPK